MRSMSEIISIDDYEFKSGEALFFDTNIWFVMYGPQTYNKPAYQNKYSSAYRRILEAKCEIFINILVVSEFINTYARIAYRQHQKKFKSFKEFRNSKYFAHVASDISNAVRKILDQSTPVGLNFDSMDLAKIVQEFKFGKLDFNDQVICEMCIHSNFKLITDDSDFMNCGAPIITANKKLF